MARAATGRDSASRTEPRAHPFRASVVDSWSLSTMNRETGQPLEFYSVKPGKRAERWNLAGPEIKRTTYKPHAGNPKEPIESWGLTRPETLKPPAPTSVPPAPPATPSVPPAM